MRRVTKIGGYDACHSFDNETVFVQPRYEKIYQMEQLGMRMIEENGGSFQRGRNIHICARQAGFDHSRTRLTTSNYCFRTPEERRYWGGMMVGIGKESVILRKAIREGYTTAEEVTEMVLARKNWIVNENGIYAGSNM